MSIEAMKLALDCMEAAIKAGDWKVDGACDPDYVFVCLRAAIEQAEKQEPVAWDITEKVRRDLDRQSCPDAFMRIAVESIAKHYTAPPQREWQGLTPEEAREISLANRPYVVDMVVALEQRLKEKNT